MSDALWSYQTPPLVFPRPAFEVWLPLPSLLAAIPMAIAGATFAVAQTSSIVERSSPSSAGGWPRTWRKSGDCRRAERERWPSGSG